MTRFSTELAECQPDPEGRRWIFVPSDQLSDRIGPLAREDPAELGIVLVESAWKVRRRPYHRQKIGLILANLRHFALEQAQRGVAVRHVVADTPYRHVLEKLSSELGPLRVMRPAERELRVDLAPLVRSGVLHEIPHEGWLSTAEDFDASQNSESPWRMDSFYRRVRRRTGVLMRDMKPIGGKFSFDAENRRPWLGEPVAPEPPDFEPDAITVEVAELIEQRYLHHPGVLDLATISATREDAERLWQWACDECLPNFGPFEDAMSRSSRGLFHSRISGVLNIHRLLPARVLADVAAMEIPLASKEGFIRQVLGWREFVYHVHERTDGFRRLPEAIPPIAAAAGDAGWSRWSGRSWPGGGHDEILDGGACPSVLGAGRSIPPGFWPGRPTGLACLDIVVKDVWADAWSHHITRLMVLSNIAALLGISPRELADWFWVAFLDAYDWVVEPNVLAMGSYGVGPLMTTKPYVSGAAYINRMSDYCSACTFDPKRDCPITSLYWAFLDRHRAAFADNPRMRLALNSLERRGEERVQRDREVFERTISVLDAGGSLRKDR
jgi:deoxyribodipyrimidine photolyase-related protein